MKKGLLFVLLISLLAFVSCTVKQVSPEAPVSGLKPSADPALVADYSSAKKRDMLERRVIECWDALQKDDYTTVYNLMDPFFRAKNRVQEFLTRTGKIKYHSYKVNDITIEGNVAKVNLDMVYSLPAYFTKSGAKFERPETENNLVETWVYVYDNWYKEYYDALGEFVYTKY